MTIYEKAAARILVPGQWTQNACARDVNGIGMSSSESSSVCWCALGSLIKEGAGGIRLSVELVNFNNEPGRTAEEVALAILLLGVAQDDL